MNRAFVTRAVLPALALASLALVFVRVHAGPPESSDAGEPSTRDTLELDGDTQALEAPPLIDDTVGGFWLSVELIGPRGAQTEAAATLADPSVEVALPRGGRPPPGELVGRVASLPEALAWIDRHAFGEPSVGFPEPGVLAERAAPIPGGPLYERHGVVATALVVTAAGELGGTREFAWPSGDQLPTPPGSDWRAAELIAGRVPLYAAPAGLVPPASERFVELSSTSEVWVLGTIDRCDAAAWCTRWAQVIAREGDRFRAGWLPSFHAVPFVSWLHDDSTPARARRFALVEAHREPGHVAYVLLEREGEQLRVTSHRVEHLGRDWPRAEMTLLGGTLEITIAGKVLESRSLREPPLAPAPTPAPAP